MPSAIPVVLPLMIVFLCSTLAAFYYGNLTHPSQDPPRMGLMSTLPANAGERLTQVVKEAQKADGNFAGQYLKYFCKLSRRSLSVFLTVTSEPAPSGTFVATSTGVGGVPQATRIQPDAPSSTSESSSTQRLSLPLDSSSFLVSLMTIVLFLSLAV